jgi:hypothetical protein
MPEIGEYTYQRGHRQIAGYLSNLFRRRLYPEGSVLPDLDELATVFLNLLSGPARVNAWGLEGDQIDIERFIVERVRLFLHGALPA